MFLAFTLIYNQNMEMKRKTLKNLLSKTNIFFSKKWLVLKFIKHEKGICFKMLLKPIKMFKQGSLWNFKEKKIYNVLFMFFN